MASGPKHLILVSYLGGEVDEDSGQMSSSYKTDLLWLNLVKVEW